jgi:ATP adenylyltransferase/5',5'''-P-1,P-4-tetraphosphate phosphorylase II
LKDLAVSASELLRSQKENWEQCYKGYKSLESVQTREFEFDGFNIYVQFNPGRITSTSAKVDPESIKERKCFLCLDNLPADQRGIMYKDEYILLCNPFPIFPEHFTIPSVDHKPQRILSSFNDFLTVSRDMSDDYLVFYNGPKCGASAPDHFHFQAGTKEFLPLVKDFKSYKKRFADVIHSDNSIELSHVNDGLRKLFIIEGDSPAGIEKEFNQFYNKLNKFSSGEEEPMMNIISVYVIQ